MSRDSRHVIVKSSHPARAPLLISVVVIGLVTCGWLLFDYGRVRSGFDNQAANAEREHMQTEILQLRKKISELSAQNAILSQASEVDKHAYAEVEDSLKSLQDQILDLKEEVAFYRGIVSTSDLARGLQIQSFKLEKNGESANFRYKVILTQYEKNNQLIRGDVSLSVVGVQDGLQKELSESELGINKANSSKFRFKYFQELDGDMVLPEGFVPLRIKLRAVPQGKASPVEKEFSWAELKA